MGRSSWASGSCTRPRDLQAQGLPAVGEVVVAGDDDEGRVRVLDAAELDDLQAVQDGDVDVHDDEIRIQRVDAGEGLHAVGGLAHHLAVVGVPVEKALEALPDDDLVVHQQDAELLHGSSFPSGSRMWAVMPPVSFSV